MLGELRRRNRQMGDKDENHPEDTSGYAKSWVLLP